MNLHLFYVGVDAAAITTVALVAARSWQLLPRHKNTWLIIAITIGAISYYLSARQDYGVLIPNAYEVDFGSFFPILNILRNATTAFFMLFVHSLFRDKQPIPIVFLFLFCVQLFLEEPLAWMIDADWALSHTRAFFLLNEVIPSSIQLLFVGSALYWILSERHADLVETRRKVRLFIFIIYVLNVVLSLAVERVAMGLDLIPWQAHYPVHISIVLIGIINSVVVLLSLNAPQSIQFLDPSIEDRPTPAPNSENSMEPDLARITTALDTEHIYRSNGLSIGEMASHLSIPEYRLRALIHNHLGFRNFNVLLHHYRIREISAALEDSTQNNTPILTLALSAGYQSINPFNRAFRESTDMTPTEYRRQSQKSRVDSSKNAPISSIEAGLK